MKKIVILIVLIFTVSSFSQKLYKVTAKNGLSIRNKPNINAVKVGILNFNETVKVIKATNFSFSYENSKGYWVEVETANSKKGYVFNGFLKPSVKNEIKYFLQKDEQHITQALIAEIDEKKFTVISFKDKECFEIVEIQDYNNNGYEEILLQSDACGGNASGYSLFAFSFNGKKFIKSDYIGYYYTDKKLHFDKNNTRFFVVNNENTGAGNTTLCKDKKETYIYKDFNFKLVSSKPQIKLNALLELKSEDFILKPSSKLSINYDLDNNGVADKITAEYWERWGTLTNCNIVLNNKPLNSEAIGSPKRIGILKSKTKNMNDLVIDCDKILKWNGQEYIE